MAGNYTATVGSAGSFNISDGSNTLFTLTDSGSVGDLSNIGAISASGSITLSDIGGSFSGSRVVTTNSAGLLDSLADGSTNSILTTNGSGALSWTSLASLGAINGSGSTNQVAFWSDSDTLASSADFYWDNTSGRLGLGINTPGATLDVDGATNLGGTVTISGNVTGTGSPTLSGFGTINGATLSGGTLSGGTISGGSVSGGSLTGGTYAATGSTVAGNYTATIGNSGTFSISDGTNPLVIVSDNGTDGTLTVNTLSATNIGAFTSTGNITGNGSNTISNFSTINGATISGGTISGGSLSAGTFSGGSVSGGSLTGGTYSNTGTTVTGSYTTTIGDAGSYTLRDSLSNTLFSIADDGSTGTLTVNTLTATNIGTFTSTGNITGNGSNTISNFSTINGATISGGSLTGGTYSNTGLTASGSYTATIGDTGTFTINDASANTLLSLLDNGSTGTLTVNTLTATNIGAFTSTGNITGNGSNTISNFSTINGATISGGSLTGGTYTGSGLTVSAGYTATISDTNSFIIRDASLNSLLTLTDNGSNGALSVANIGAFTLTGNISGSGSPTLSGLVTINTATISGGSLTGGPLSGGTYTATGMTVTGSYTSTINNGGTYTIADSLANSLFTVADGGAVGNISNVGTFNASGQITLSNLGGAFSSNRIVATTSAGILSSISDAGSSGQVLSSNASGVLSWITPVTGSGSSGRVTFWNGTNTITSNSNFFWDDTNSRLGIGDTTPAAALTVGNGDLFQVDSSGRAFLPSGALSAGQLSLSFTGDTNTGIYNSANDSLDFVTGGARALSLLGSASGVNYLTLTPGTTGNSVGINTAGADSNVGMNFTTKGTGVISFTSANQTGAGTNSAFTFNADSLTTGNGLYVSSTSTNMTTGSLFSVISTANLSNYSGRFANIDWSPTLSSTSTGDLFRINLGPNANIGNLFNVTDNGITLFNVSESVITSAQPHKFTAPGDVLVAYDLAFTNQGSSFIRSNAPLTLEVGESWESNDLTLKTNNLGQVIVDSPGGMYFTGNGTYSAAGTALIQTSDNIVSLSTSPSTFYANSLGSMTLQSSSGTGRTVTTASTLYVATPVVGSNMTITNNRPITTQAGGYLTSGGSWTNSSDATLKENFLDLNKDDILAKINSLSVRQWNYIAEGASIKHVGPTAQDFYATFGLGDSDTAISTIDPSGLALIGIQALNDRYTAMQTLIANNSGTTTSTTPVVDPSQAARNVLANEYKMQIENEVIVINRSVAMRSGLSASGEVTLDGQLTVYGKATFENETIFKQLTSFFQTTIFKGKTEFEDKITYKQDAAGIAIIEQYEDYVTVVFEREYETVPVITISLVQEQEATASSFLKWYYVKEKSTKGFTIQLDVPTEEALSFNWIAMQVKEPKVTRTSDNLKPSPSIINPADLTPPLPSSSIEPSLSPSPSPDELEPTSMPSTEPSPSFI